MTREMDSKMAIASSEKILGWRVDLYFMFILWSKDEIANPVNSKPCVLEPSVNKHSEFFKIDRYVSWNKISLDRDSLLKIILDDKSMEQEWRMESQEYTKQWGLLSSFIRWAWGNKGVVDNWWFDFVNNDRIFHNFLHLL